MTIMDPVNCFMVEKLPRGFVFPNSFLNFLNQSSSPDILPWQLPCFRRGHSDICMKYFREAYPFRVLVPFAKKGSLMISPVSMALADR